MPGVAQGVCRVIALFFHDRCTRREWVISSTPRPHFSPGKDPVPILQEAGWAPGPVWTSGKSCPHLDSILDRPARSQSLYWLSYPAHTLLLLLLLLLLSLRYNISALNSSTLARSDECCILLTPRSFLSVVRNPESSGSARIVRMIEGFCTSCSLRIATDKSSNQRNNQSLRPVSHPSVQQATDNPRPRR